MKFEWDSQKAKINAEKHGITFEEASKLFRGRADFVEIFDQSHSVDEDRFIAIGPIVKGIVVVVYIEKSLDLIRIISARKATKKETYLFLNFKKGVSK
jgi:uncharacterized DUF497 family protein